MIAVKPKYSLEEYLSQWDAAHKKAHQTIPLFNPERTRNLSAKQKKYFVEIFYHAICHSYKFLCALGNKAPPEYKGIIVQNIAEEFGGDSRSHEQLYQMFAASLSVELLTEFTEENNYPGFLQNYSP